MPETIVVASIGNRDLLCKSPAGGGFLNPGYKRDAEELAKHLCVDGKLRAISKKLRESPKLVADHFELPILRPGLEYVLKQGQPIDKLLMIVTDQETTVPFRDDDTIHCGELLAELAPAKFRIRSADPRFLVVTKDPTTPNVMYPLIRDKLSTLSRAHPDSALYALPTGGTPAIKDGLRHAAMNVFRGRHRRRCSVIQVDRPIAGAAGTPRIVQWEPYLEDAVRGGAEALVKKGNFAGALEMLRASGRGSWPAAAISLLKHADSRVNLQAADAAVSGKTAQQEFPKSMSMAEPLRDALDSVAVTRSPDAELASVNEVRFLVKLALDQKRYSDALVRIEQFRESAQSVFSLGVLGLLRYVGQPLPVGSHSELDAWLRRALAVQRGRLWPMHNDRDKQSLFDFARSRPAAAPGRDLERLLGDERWSRLARLRNKSIHTPEGVTPGRIDRVIQLGPLQELLQQTAVALYKSLGKVHVPDYPYPALQNAILDLLSP